MTYLLALGTRRSWKKGESLFQAGAPGGTFFKIIKGVVAVHTMLRDGRQQILSLHKVGDACGYLQHEGTYQFSGDAITDVEACTFDRRGFDRLADHLPDLAKAVAEELSARLKSTAEAMTAIGQLKASERLAYFLLQMCDMLADRNDPGTAVVLPLTRQQIGRHLGLTLETVSRSFSQLRKCGLVLSDGESIVIPDRARLSEFAVLSVR